MLAAGPLVVALVLLAALLHASWNALARASGDPLVNVAIQSATGGLLAVPVMLSVPLPTGETWGWLGASACIHFVYQVTLARMYELGELSQVYPVARGMAPLGVAALGAAFLGETLTPAQCFGLALAAVALVALGRAGQEGRTSRRALGLACGVALMVMLYTFSDGRGVRTVDHPASFISWSFFFGCVPLAVYAAQRRRGHPPPPAREWWRAIAGGVMATAGYSVALWAMGRAPLALVSSLRETSVLFAALLGWLFLGESFGRRRVVASALLVLGLVLVQRTG